MAVLAAVVAVAVAGCGTSDKASSSTSSSGAGGGTLVVFAAASLKKPFTEIGEQFKTDNPGPELSFRSPDRPIW